MVLMILNLVAQFSSGINTCEKTARAMKKTTSTTLTTLAILASFWLSGHTSLAQEVPQTHLRRATLSVGIHQMDVQLALTPQEQAIGLMQRAEMPANEGMLFVFEDVSKRCFWMKNTLLPLTAAFVSDDGRIVNLEDMQPQTLDSHCSRKPVRFVLEMHQGWFARKGIKPGAQLSGPMFGTSTPDTSKK